LPGQGQKKGKAAPRICHGGILKPFCRLREALPKQNLIKLAYIGQRGFDHVGIH